MGFWHSDEAPDLVLVYDIGSSTVAAALVSFEQDNKPFVHYSVRKPISFRSTIDSDKLLFDKKNTLKAVTDDVVRIGLGRFKLGKSTARIREIHCVFASPWFISKTAVVKMEKKESFTIIETVLASLVGTEEERFKKGFTGGENGSGEITVIERKIVQTKLNGYEVSDIYTKPAKSLELSIFLSGVEARVADHVRSVLHPAFGFRKLHFHSFPLAAFAISRDLFHDAADFLIADVRGEMTDVSLVEKNNLLETISFPLGNNFLLRKIGEALGSPPEVTVSFLDVYLRGKADGKMKTNIENVLKQAEYDWRSIFKSALSDLSTRSL